ncbi:MAG: sigma-70 family RNA polymerase sigma factor [Phycisphaeraceae bacterium]
MTTFAETAPSPQAGPETVQEWWQAYKLTGSPELRERLVLHYLPQVRRIATNQMRRLPRWVRLEEVESAGVLGLLKAVEAFEPSRGIDFACFCHHRIRGAMLDALREADWMSRNRRSAAKKYQAVADKLVSRLGRTPCEAEISDELDASKAALGWMMSASRETRKASLDDVTLPDPPAQADHSHPGLRAVMAEELRQFITQVLTGTDQLILVLYYFENLKLAEIAAMFSVSEPRISQRLNGALKLLRERLE